MAIQSPMAPTPTATTTQTPAGSTAQAPQNGGKQPAQGQQTQPQKTDDKTSADAARKLKLKLEGKDVELTESEVIALAQRGTVSDKRFQEAAALRKQADDVLRFAKENPAEFFKRTGMNARQWAEEYLMQELKREQMNPEQKKAWENEQKLKRFEADEKARADKAKQDELAALQKKHHDNYEKTFVEALGKSGLPKTPYTIKRMAELQLVNLKKKLELSPDQLAKVVREDYIAEQKSLFGSLEGDKLMELLGEELIKKLSKAQIAKLKAKGTGAGGTPPVRSSGSEKAPMSWKEYQRRNRRLP